MLRLLTRARGFTAVLLIFIAVALGLLIAFPPEYPTVWANAHGSKSFDHLFNQVTLLGDWVIYLLAVAVGWRISHSRAVATIFALAVTGLTVSLLKHQVFPERNRPASVLGEMVIREAANSELHHRHSFPSGHTATAFAGFCCLAYFTRSMFLHILFGLGACTVAYSRLYLGQHFLGDVLAGAVIGSSAAYLSEWFFFVNPPAWLKKMAIFKAEHEKSARA
jgi:membrane-associated phospholipid phosphatase